MHCSQTDWISDREFLERFSRKAIQNRIPLSGSIDLTYRCNFRCIHCYLGDRRGFTAAPANELGTKKWLNIIDQITEAGCLFLLITGGDPLLHPDFCTLYRYAKNKGLIITVFTNGTTLTDEILGTLQESPPRLVEITLYGATEKTCRAITGQSNVLSRCRDTVARLKSCKIEVGLKTVLMKVNIEEFGQLKQAASELGVKFRHDAAIFPRFDDSGDVIGLRVPAAQAVEIDFEDPERAGEWSRYYTRMASVRLDDHLYQCGSGVTTFHITADGLLQPCIMSTSVQYDLKTGDFADGWSTVIPRVRQKKREKSSPCSGCDKITLCGICPPVSFLETGSEEGLSEYLCSLGHCRYGRIREES